MIQAEQTEVATEKQSSDSAVDYVQKHWQEVVSQADDASHTLHNYAHKVVRAYQYWLEDKGSRTKARRVANACSLYYQFASFE